MARNTGAPWRIRTIRDRTRLALQDAASPTQLIAVRSRDAEVSDNYAHDVIDLTLRMGEALLSAGAPAADVTAAVLRVAAGFGLTSCQVDITFTSITLSVVRDDGEPITAMRILKLRTIDYTRLADLYDLSRRAAEGLVLADALSDLDRIVRAPRPYRRWISTLALAGMAAAVCFLLGGDPIIATVGAMTTAFIDRMLHRLNRMGLPTFFQQVAGAVVVTAVTMGVYAARETFDIPIEGLRPSVVVASGLIVLLAGLSTVGAAEDAISGHYLTAAARGFEVAMLTTGLVIGISAVLDLSQRIGVPLPTNLSGATAAGHVSMPYAVLLSAMIAACWSLSSYAKFRAVLAVGLVGGVAYAVYAGAQHAGIGVAVASGLAATVVGLIAESVGPRLGVPALIISTCGIVPLLPGLAIYNALFVLVSRSTNEGLPLLLGAAAIGLALAAGVTLGEFVATPLRAGFDRWDRRARRQARARRD